MTKLLFCRDGVLRRSCASWNPVTEVRTMTYVPLRAYQEAIDPDAFLKSIHAMISFEDGLTVGALFENLAPWSEIMTGIACMDFPAFIEEIRTDPEDPLDEFDKVVISFISRIEPVPKFERGENPDSYDVLLIGKPVRSGRLRIEAEWDMSAIVKPECRAENDGAESMSLSYVSLSDWKHLPVEIDAIGEFRDETAWDGNAVYLGTDKTLTRHDHPNIDVVKTRNGKAVSHRMTIDAPCPTFFECLVQGFLWDVGFHYAPVMRNERRQDIEERVAGVLEGEDTEAEDKDDLAEFHEEQEEIRIIKAKAAELGLSVRDSEVEA